MVISWLSTVPISVGHSQYLYFCLESHPTELIASDCSDQAQTFLNPLCIVDRAVVVGDSTHTLIFGL